MKNFLIAAMLIFGLTGLQAQKDPSKRKSPLKTVEAKIGSVNATLNYGSPSKKGRDIFGDLVPYGKVWRTGANEATTLEIDGDIMVAGKKLAKGKYSVFTIPGEKEWTIIFNSVWDQWGAYKYKEDKDVLRVMASPEMANDVVESFTIAISGKSIDMSWDAVVVRVPVSN